MSHHQLEVRNLSFSYPDGHLAIRDLSVRILQDEAVGVIGANGAGKSTLLLLLMGVLFPDAGEILVGDVHVTRKSLPMIRQRLGLIFQNPDDQLFMPTVYEDVAFGPRNELLDEQDVRTRVNDALELVGLTGFGPRSPSKLSGGEKRAAAIASVLSMKPDVLIMDEPTAALDPRSRRRVIDWLNHYGHTRIIASHDLDLILDTCQRVIVVRSGSIVADGPARLILNDANLLDQCGLELPLTVQGSRSGIGKTEANDGQP